MAESLMVGILFSDGSCFNTKMPLRHWHDIQSGVNGNWNLQELVGELASHAGLQLSCQNIQSVVEGGIGNMPEGVLGHSNDSPPNTERQPVDLEESFNDSFSGETSQSNSSSTFQWTHSAVLLLIETYRKHKHMLNDSTKKASQMWRTIHREIIAQAQEYNLSPEQCKKKMDNLRSRFKIIKDRNGRTGRGRSSWIYYDRMNELIGGDPDVTPPAVVSSLSGRKESESTDTMDLTVTHAEDETPATDEDITAHGPPLAEKEARRRRRDRRNEPPQWFKKHEKKQEELMERLVSAVEKRNDLLESLLQKL